MPRARGAAAVLLALWTTVALAQAPEAALPPGPLTLAAALQHAADHYPAVRAALEEVTASAASVDVARSAYLPRVDAVWQSNRGTVNNITGPLLPQSVVPGISGPPLAATSWQSVWGSAAGALLSWEPLDLGLRAATVREAEAGAARARAEQVLTRLDVQQAVGVAYLGVVAARQALTAADADASRRDVLARAARVLADNQLRPGAEASRAEAERAAAATRAIQARQAVVVAEATLARALGTTTAVVDVDAAGLLSRLPEPPPSEAPAAHPWLQVRQASIDLSRARESVLAATYRPRVFLQSSVSARGSGAAYNGALESGAEGLWLERTNWAAGVQVVFPNLFDFAALRARRHASAAITRAEAARYAEGLLAVTSQQRAAAAFVDAARAIARNTPVQVSSARESEAQARARFDAGLASVVEVADAQALLATAEYQDAVAHVDVWRALLAQAVAHGGVERFIALVRGGQ